MHGARQTIIFSINRAIHRLKAALTDCQSDDPLACRFGARVGVRVGQEAGGQPPWRPWTGRTTATRTTRTMRTMRTVGREGRGGGSRGPGRGGRVPRGTWRGGGSSVCGAGREPFIVSYNVCIRAYITYYAYICILLASSIWNINTYCTHSK